MTDSLACDLDSCPCVSPNLVLREESDECALLFDPASGKVHLLNPSAVAVWKRLDGCKSLREIVPALAEDFEGMGPDAAEQIVALARSLVVLGALRVLPSKSGP